MKSKEKPIIGYCIAFDGELDIGFIRKTKKESIRALLVTDSDRMGWSYEKRENKATCVKIIIKKVKK